MTWFEFVLQHGRARTVGASQMCVCSRIITWPKTLFLHYNTLHRAALPAAPQMSQIVQDMRALLAGLPVGPAAALLPAATLAELGEQGATLAAAAARLAAQCQEVVATGRLGPHELPTLALTAAAVVLGTTASMGAPGANAAPDGVPVSEADAAEIELGYEYDPQQLAQYFSRRPVLVMRRAAEVWGMGWHGMRLERCCAVSLRLAVSSQPVLQSLQTRELPSINRASGGGGVCGVGCIAGS